MTTAQELTILANPGHGNGPTVALLMAAEAIERISGRPVNLIFPDLPRAPQRFVIKMRRAPGRKLRVFFDARLGKLLGRITLRDNDFRQNVSDIADSQEDVQALGRAHVARGLRNLVEFTDDGKDSPSACEFQAEDLTLELNHGSRAAFLPRERAFYFFPCMLSDLLKSPEVMSTLDESTRAKALSRITALEASYARIFLPIVHTFSWDSSWKQPSNVCFTPFPRPAPESQSSAPPKGPGVYLMPSGVGNKGNELVVKAARAMLEALGEALAIYYPPADEPPKGFKERFPHAVPLNPRAIPHPDIRFVVGRAGWGTLWECLNAAKVFVAIPALPGDDPEIKFNLRTLRNRNLGIVWEEGMGALKDHYSSVKQAIQDFLAELNKDFGTIDGLEVMAREIIAALSQTQDPSSS